MLLRLLVKPYRELLRPSYRQRPVASSVLRSYIRKRDYPSWTSYFIEYKQIQDDDFGQKHFNFDVDGQNYHVLRVGCFPYIKYHCTKRPVQDLSTENNLYRVITVLNLGIPCLLYGLAAICLIKHTDSVVDEQTGRTQSFIRDMVAPSCCLEYRPTAYFWLILLFVVFPAIYLCGKVVGCIVTVLLRVLRGLCRFLLWDEADYEEEAKLLAAEHEVEVRRLVEEREFARKEERRRRREEKKRLRELHAMTTVVPKQQANGKNVTMNGTSSEVITEEKHQPSDNSDSLISECEDETSQATSGVVVCEPRSTTGHVRHRVHQHKELH